MSMTDPIADMLTRIRNATHARKASVDMPWSRHKEAIARVLREDGVAREHEIRPGEQAVHLARILGARHGGAAVLALADEVARRESIDATDDDVEQEIEKFAGRAGRTPAAVRARLEKDGAMDRIRAGVRREKTMAWLIEKANVTHG